jgi:Protein of unknown function (DUF6044)
MAKRMEAERSRSAALGDLLQRRPWLVYVVLALLAFPILEMLVAGERAVQYSHDVFDDDVPRLFSIAPDWGTFGPHLWDPHLTAGNALLAQFALPPAAPDVLLSFVVPPFVAYAVNAALMAFAAGLGMHLFLRDSLRLPSVACFAGGIVAALSFWHYILGYGALLLPLFLWSADRVLVEGSVSRRQIVIAIAIVWFAFLSSQVQLVVLAGALTLVYVLGTAGTFRRWLGQIARLAAIWGVAALAAGPILISQLVALPDSHRTIWDLAYLAGPQGEALRNAGLMYGSLAFGLPVTSDVGGSAGIYGTFFPGVIGLPFLALSLVVPRRTARERVLLAILLAIPVIDVLAILAVPIQDHLGLLRTFQFVRVRHLLPILVAMNVAVAGAFVMRPDPIHALSRARWAIGGLLLALIGGALAVQGVVATRHVLRPTSRALAQLGWDLGFVSLACGVAVLIAVAVLALRRRREWVPTGLLSTGLAAMLLFGLGAERLLYARAERDFDGHLGTWAGDLAPTSGHQFIAAQPGSGRVLSIGEHANRALAAGLATVDGYQVIYPLRYHELFGALIGPHLAVDAADEAYFNGWGSRAYAFGPELDWPIADLLGTRWLYVRGGTPLGPDVAARFRDGDVTVYENPAAFPRVFVVHSARLFDSRAALLAALGTATADDLRASVYLAAPDAAGLTLPGGPPDPADLATIVTDTPDRVRVTTRGERPGALVLADTFAAGWNADIDGTPATIVPAYDALRAVAIPAGEHTVTFSYRPAPTLVGVALAAVTAVLLAVWQMAGSRLEAAVSRVRRR